MQIINLTPHAININKGTRTDADISAGIEMDINAWHNVPASGRLARVEEVREWVGTIPFFGIPVSKVTYGKVEGLPDPQPDTIFLVSSLVLAQCAGRGDVFAPGPAIRDSEGHIIGCDGLSAAPVLTADESQTLRFASIISSISEVRCGERWGVPPTMENLSEPIKDVIYSASWRELVNMAAKESGL